VQQVAIGCAKTSKNSAKPNEINTPVSKKKAFSEGGSAAVARGEPKQYKHLIFFIIFVERNSYEKDI